jgi:hypothetical protein
VSFVINFAKLLAAIEAAIRSLCFIWRRCKEAWARWKRKMRVEYTAAAA